MPFRIGWPELLIILLIVLLLFGGRLTKSASELAKGIKIFQKTMKENEEDTDKSDEISDIGNVVKEETKKKEE